MFLCFQVLRLGHFDTLQVVPLIAPFIAAPNPVHGLAIMLAIQQIEAFALGTVLIISKLLQLLFDHLLKIKLHRILLLNLQSSLRCQGIPGPPRLLQLLIEILIKRVAPPLSLKNRRHESPALGILAGRAV